MISRNIFLWSVVIAMGGFLFGFDTIVISGAQQSVQNFWPLNAFEHRLTISIALTGAVTGSLLQLFPQIKPGAKKPYIFIIAMLFLVSSPGTSAREGNAFHFICVMMCLQLIFVWKQCPEQREDHWNKLFDFLCFINKYTT